MLATNWSCAARSKPPETRYVAPLTSAFLCKPQRPQVLLVAALLQGLWMSVGQASEIEPLVITADRSQDCAAALLQGRQQRSVDGLPTSFSLLNWNVEKAQHPDLIREFADFAQRSDLIFLQEAVPLRKTDTVIEQSLYEAFVRGYVQNEIDTGVLTLAKVPHLVHCHLLATEPWLRTPKATSVTLYPLANSEQPLLTVNLHAINFSFGVTAYAAQLNAVAGLIAAHRGPVIFGGDLNTWSERRQRTLEALASDLNLAAVPFSPDYRTTRFNRALDHLYVRGLTWRTTQTLPVTTSDHNPLIATLQRDDA